MLFHPFLHKQALRTIPGTRMLEETFGLVGTPLVDPLEPWRGPWVVDSLLAPIEGRMIGGVRAKVRDSKGFVSFVNQRDLEVLLGIGVPGTWCEWLDAPYQSPDSKKWFGLCADREDLLDDMFERELLFRANYPSPLQNLDFKRRVHMEAGVDSEQTYVLLWDADPETGISPDDRIETVERRWSRIEYKGVRWQRLSSEMTAT